MADKKLVLRIGSDKAGTVSLAQFIVDNRNPLARLGVYAPQRNCVTLIDKFAKDLSLSQLDLFDASPHLELNPLERTLFAGFLADRFWERYDTVFLSTEVIWGRLTRKRLDDEPERDEIRRLFGAVRAFSPDRRTIVLLHLRRADFYFESLYNQHVKAGGKDEPSRFWTRLLAQNRARKSLDLLDLLEEGFGRENIVIRPFERSQLAGGDLIDDTLELLGIAPEQGRCLSRAIGNERLHRLLVEALPCLNATHGKLLTNASLLAVSAALARNTALENHPYLLTRSERNGILAHFADFYSEVSQRYRNGGELFSERVDTLPEPRAASADAIAKVTELLLELAPHERSGTLEATRIETALETHGLASRRGVAAMRAWCARLAERFR